MNVAHIELCKELYELSGWAGLNDLPRTEDMLLEYFSEALMPGYGGIPQYTLSYLLRKLPQNTWVGYTDTSGQRGYAQAQTYAWNEKGDDIIKVTQCSADTPEDAACKLAIELCTRNILKRGD